MHQSLPRGVAEPRTSGSYRSHDPPFLAVGIDIRHYCRHTFTLFNRRLGVPNGCTDQFDARLPSSLLHCRLTR